ncbi:recombinase family protein [Pandoraea sputorum]|uniref:recombinase family protein n=1 Tax=Pandoraea sputorum TaxID=93222 RepID=UPI001241DDFB|nr:recombinase family protein [Pandoraea sputorum]VVE82968.1 invertase [Pandoraea sputorum]
MMIGYARVSTEDQNLDLQIQALKRLGCDKVFTDHGVSGSATSRPGLERAMTRLKPGDKLVVWRLDRLGRSLAHLVRLLESLGRRDILFQSLTEHIDTSSSGGRLVFHMMAALAEFERSLISERTRAGMAAARANGKHLGRRPLLSPEQVGYARSLLDDGTTSTHEVALQLGVHPRTVTRMLARVDEPAVHEDMASRRDVQLPIS